MKSLKSFTIYTPIFVWLFLVVCSFAVFIDQGISFAVTPEIREDPKIAAVNDDHHNHTQHNSSSSSTTTKPVLTTAQAGLFSSVFLLGFFVGVPLTSMIAPTLGTNRLIHLGLILYLAAIVGTAFANNFYSLLACRFFVGFSEAGFMPFSVNIIDLMFDFPEFSNEDDDETEKLLVPESSSSKKKTMYLSAYFAALPIGGSIGMSIGGAIGQHVQLSSSLPGWRSAFLLVDAALALILMLVSFGLPREYDLDQLQKRCHLAKKKNDQQGRRRIDSSLINGENIVSIHHPRHAIDNNNDNEVATNESFEGAFSIPFFTSLSRLMFHNPEFVLVSLGFSLFDFLVNIFSSFATIMLVQGPYGISSSTEASTILGVSSAICGLLGTLFGGYIVDHYFQKSDDDNGDEKDSSSASPSSSSKLVFKICLLGIVCSAFAVPLALLASMSSTTTQFLVFFVPSMFLINVPTPGMTVVLLEVVDQQMKPYAMSISMEVMVLFGDLAAPLVTGFLSNAFGGVCDGVLDSSECVGFGNTTSSSTGNNNLDFFTWLWDADDASKCRWIEASQKSSGALSYCANVSQVNRGLFVASCFVFLQIPFWSVVAWRAFKEKLTVMMEVKVM